MPLPWPDERHHIAELVADNQIARAVTVEITDRQAVGQVAGIVLTGRLKVAVPVAAQDRDRVMIGVEHGQIEMPVGEEMAGSHDRRPHAREQPRAG